MGGDMKTGSFWAAAVLISTLAALGLAERGKMNQDPAGVWDEFVAALKKVTAERIRPYYPDLEKPLLGYLAEMRGKASWEEWSTPEETRRIGNRVHVLISLTFDKSRATYCFTFVVEGGRWYFQHLEAINIRLDKVGSLPASTFPEIRWSREIRLFNLLAQEKGKDFAFDFFKEGKATFLAARTWVPFVEPESLHPLHVLGAGQLEGERSRPGETRGQ
jgi:hypothetical protein